MPQGGQVLGVSRQPMGAGLDRSGFDGNRLTR